MSKKLVAYFSATGITKKAALKLAELADVTVDLGLSGKMVFELFIGIDSLLVKRKRGFEYVLHICLAA